MIVYLVTFSAESAQWLIVLTVFGMGQIMPDEIRRVCKPMFFDTRWLWLPAVIWSDVVMPVMNGGIDPWGYAGLAIDLVAWWWLRAIKDDDDRWKRRRRKAADAVRAAGARLIVVPQTA